MRKILKNVKCGIGLCLAVAMLLSVPVFAEATATSQKWSVTNQDSGDSATVTAFGAVAANANVLKPEAKKDKSCYGATYNINGSVEVKDGQWLVIDVNLASDMEGASVTARGGVDRLTTKDKFEIEANKWHSVRLAVKSPDGTKVATEGDNLAYSEHKLFVDGKLVRHYAPTNLTDHDNKMMYNNGTQPDNEGKWYIRLLSSKTVSGVKTFYSNYSSDLRISVADSVDDTFEIPTLSTNDNFAVVGNTIYSKSAAGLSMSDITYPEGAVTATRKSADGSETAVENVLAAGDTILVKDKNQFLNTYTYMGDRNMIFKADSFDALDKMNKTRVTVTNASGQFGKTESDSAAKLEATGSGNNAGDPYISDSTAKNMVKGSYIIFETNIVPLGKMTNFNYSSDWGYGLTPAVKKEQLVENCWNKVIYVVETTKNKEGKYPVEIYINGKQSSGTAGVIFGDIVTNADASKVMKDLRLSINTNKEIGDAAIVDDVKVYETFYKPVISEYTVTDSKNAVYDSESNIFYAADDANIAEACGGTVAKSGNGFVIINRGDENYSRYNVRTIESGKIGIDKTAKEFWSTADSIGADDCFILAKYNSDNSKTTLSGAEIIKGTRIGNYVIKGNYTTETGKITMLYFWDIKTLEAKAGSEPITE